MRTKYSIAACLFALSFFTSCNDSFLQRDPKDKYSDVSFWKTHPDVDVDLLTDDYDGLLH